MFSNIRIPFEQHMKSHIKNQIFNVPLYQILAMLFLIVGNGYASVLSNSFDSSVIMNDCSMASSVECKQITHLCSSSTLECSIYQMSAILTEHDITPQFRLVNGAILESLLTSDRVIIPLHRPPRRESLIFS